MKRLIFLFFIAVLSLTAKAQGADERLGSAI